MSASIVRNGLPVVTALVSTLFLATAVPRDLPEPSATTWLADAEVQRCVAGGRATDACLDEADGRALIERADALSTSALDRRASR
jgi:hypothetical protein